jgi:hypothetical protein
VDAAILEIDGSFNASVNLAQSSQPASALVSIDGGAMAAG